MQRAPSGEADSWIDYQPTISHLVSITYNYCRYYQDDNTVYVAMNVSGTTDGSASGTEPQITLPVQAWSNGVQSFYTQVFVGLTDNGSYQLQSAGIGDPDIGHFTLYHDYSGNGIGFDFFMEFYYEALV